MDIVTKRCKLILVTFALSIPAYILFGFAVYELILSLNIIDTINADGRSWKINYDLVGSQTPIITNLCVWNPGDCTDNTCDITDTCIDLKKGYLDMAKMTIVATCIIIGLFVAMAISSIIILILRMIISSRDLDTCTRGLDSGLTIPCTFIIIYVIYTIIYLCMLITLYDFDFNFDDSYGSIQRIQIIHNSWAKIGNQTTVDALKYYWNLTAGGWSIISVICISLVSLLPSWLRCKRDDPHECNCNLLSDRNVLPLNMRPLFADPFVSLILFVPMCIYYVIFCSKQNTTNNGPIQTHTVDRTIQTHTVDRTIQEGIRTINPPPSRHPTSPPYVYRQRVPPHWDFNPIEMSNNQSIFNSRRISPRAPPSHRAPNPIHENIRTNNEHVAQIEMSDNRSEIGSQNVSPDPVEVVTTDINCPICLESISSNDKSVTACAHVFHQTCLRKVRNNTCPICRYPLQ